MTTHPAWQRLEAPGRVVVRWPSCHELAALLCACLDRGLVAVPLHPRATDDEVADVVDRTAASLIVDGPPAAPRVRAVPGEPQHPAAAGLAFIMFTSGSTGRPKGVMLGREAVEGNAAKVAALHGFSPARPHGTCLPLYHVNALMMSLLGTRLTAAQLVLCERFEPTAYFAGLGRAGARTASIVPALLQELVEQGPAWPESLEYLITAAAPLTSDLADRFYRLYGPRLRQGYGLSEAVNFSFVMPTLDAADFRQQYVAHPPPVGLPLPETTLRLEDGEVWLRTPDRMRGYWQDPEATIAAVTPDGWLRTGDLGELRDGLLVLNGRRSEVINRGGEKYHPLEVERHWRAAGLTGSFAAVPVPSERLGQEFGLVLAADDGPDLAGLCRDSRFRPAVVATGQFLVTSTGKPRRRAMGERLVAAGESAQRYDALLSYARQAAEEIVGHPVRPRNARASRIHAHALATVAAVPETRPGAGPRSAAHDALDALVEHWPALADGSCTGQDVMRTCPGLWRRLMTEWPMGSYAALAADTLAAAGVLGGRVLEVGSGVGNTTGRIAPLVTGELVWSDGAPELVERGSWPGRGVVFDFDRPPPADLGTFDTIFGTNAVHCAADKLATLRWLRGLLAGGGRLFLSEGANPTTATGTPWALDFLFCAFDGWWDRGGFRTRAEWLDLLRRAGFGNPGFSMLRSGRHDLGGVIWAAVE
ncbi:AMP-binding protein [Micromonospora sp. CPCC 206060]|uniref:AMP-binding protein n=1 Tax=Micromonospora sp. CPCC 206060 TaxID=3122406 RepID=UPI002FF036EB